jgi:hypothetical protein
MDYNRYMQKELIKKLKLDLKHTTLQNLALKIGLGYGTLYRFVYKGTSGTVKSWVKIESYYRKLS